MIFTVRDEYDFETKFKVGDRLYACGYKLADNGTRPYRDLKPMLFEVTSYQSIRNLPCSIAPVGKNDKPILSKATRAFDLHFTDNIDEAWALYRDDLREAQRLAHERSLALKETEKKLADKLAECACVLGKEKGAIFDFCNTQ